MSQGTSSSMVPTTGCCSSTKNRQPTSTPQMTCCCTATDCAPHQEEEESTSCRSPTPTTSEKAQARNGSTRKFMLAGSVMYKSKPKSCCPMCNMFIITHAVPILLFSYFFYEMFQSVVNTPEEMIAATIYCGCMIVLFAVSSMYHLVCLVYGKFSDFTYWFRVFDYATIYLFIGASYTPFLMIVEVGQDNIYGKLLVGIVWTIAVCGLIKSFSENRTFKGVSSVFLFNLMGWVMLVILPPTLFVKVPLEFFLFILLGGIFFSSGCIIINGDGWMPFAHAIWHVFVVLGIGSHFMSLYIYLLNLDAHFHPEKHPENNLMLWEQVLNAVQLKRDFILSRVIASH